VTSPGDRILAGLQGSKSLAPAETVPGSEDAGSVLAEAQARLEEAQAHLEQVQARLEQLESQREERFQARLDRAQARLDKIETLPERAKAARKRLGQEAEPAQADSAPGGARALKCQE
jgi:chromosome segregation ATPase